MKSASEYANYWLLVGREFKLLVEAANEDSDCILCLDMGMGLLLWYRWR